MEVLMHSTNIRLGFATNSSSTHSVILSGGPPEFEKMAGEPSTFEFGWDDFALSCASDKAAYLAAGVYHSIKDVPEWQRRAILREVFAGTPVAAGLEDAFRSQWTGIYIDHQSAFTLPGIGTDNFGAVFKEALQFFCDKRLTVYGGNDNNDTPMPGIAISRDDYDPLRFRRDGDAYVVFNWRTGGKMRLAPEGATYDKSSSPELVDLKITDGCQYGCSFCYQGSTPSGQDGDINAIGDIIKALGINGLGIFELAIGGGEPTASEHFASTITFAVENVIKPSFTTFAVDWLLDERKVAAAKLCGGIGVSVHNAKDLHKVAKIQAAVPGVSIVAQHVYGSMSAKDTADLIIRCTRDDIHLLLLGYKTTGRGGQVKPHGMTKIVEHLPSYSLKAYGRLSADTALVASHPELMEHLRVNNVFVSTKEGAFSMYVDAVTMEAARSSYDDGARTRIGRKTARADVAAAFQSY